MTRVSNPHLHYSARRQSQINRRNIGSSLLRRFRASLVDRRQHQLPGFFRYFHPNPIGLWFHDRLPANEDSFGKVRAYHCFRTTAYTVPPFGGLCAILWLPPRGRSRAGVEERFPFDVFHRSFFLPAFHVASFGKPELPPFGFGI